MVKPISMYCHRCGDIKFYDALPQLQWADEPSPFEQMRAAVRENVERVSLTTASGEDLDALAKSVGAKTDPWVKVGTTTIDGTLAQVKSCMEESDPDRDVESAIDAFVRAGAANLPWMIGGRHLLALGSHINSHAGTALIRCDIVRRQSEIEAEQQEKAAERLTIAVERYEALHPTICPECGPHGNRGEVLLASSWAKCTTCAGGKTGDLWGEVKTPGPATAQEALSSALIAEGASSEVAQAGVRAFVGALNKPAMSFMDARREALAAQKQA